MNHINLSVDLLFNLLTNEHLRSHKETQSVLQAQNWSFNKNNKITFT